MKNGLSRGSYLAGSTGELQVLFSRDLSQGQAGMPATGASSSNSNRDSNVGKSSSLPNGSAHHSGRDGLLSLQSIHGDHSHHSQQTTQKQSSPLHQTHSTPARKVPSPRVRHKSDTISPLSYSPAAPGLTSLPSFSALATYSALSPVHLNHNVVISSFSALLYGTVGLTMGFLNKAVLQLWPFSNSLLMFQMAASVAIICFGTVLNLVETRPLSLRTAASLWGVVFFYNANVAFALAAVQALSIPVYHVLKRLTPVMIILFKMLMGEPPPPLQVTLSVCTVVAGCFLSGMGDLSFDLRGYMFAIVSCALQSAYLIFVEQSGSDKGFSSSELMVYNAVMSLPVLVLLTMATGEATRSIPALIDLFLDRHSSFPWVFGLSLVAGVLLNYSLFLCTLNNTALTTTIIGALRSVLGTILGFFLLGGVKATPQLIAGCAINTMGGVWYTVAKMRHKMLSHGAAAKQSPLPQDQSKGNAEERMPLKSNIGP